MTYIRSVLKKITILHIIDMYYTNCRPVTIIIVLAVSIQIKRRFIASLVSMKKIQILQ